MLRDLAIFEEIYSDCLYLPCVQRDALTDLRASATQPQKAVHTPILVPFVAPRACQASNINLLAIYQASLRVLSTEPDLFPKASWVLGQVGNDPRISSAHNVVDWVLTGALSQSQNAPGSLRPCDPVYASADAYTSASIP